MVNTSVIGAALGSVLWGVAMPVCHAETHSPCVEQYGQMVCGAGVQEDVNASGMVNLAQTEVTGSTQVRGTFVARDAKLHDVTVSGTTTLLHSDVQGAAHFQGYLRAQETLFHQGISVASDIVDILDSQLSSIEISSDGKAPLLSLAGSTVVNGDVVFVGQPGQVKLSDQARITGKVSNGKILKHGKHQKRHHKSTGEKS